jgi:hypothetical protein
MPRVTDTAAAGAAVRIDITDPGVRPGFRRRAAFLIELDFGAMTLDAAGFVRSATQFRMLLALVNRRQGVKAVLGNLLPISPEMPAGVELFNLVGMTLAADGRRHQKKSASPGQ